MGTIILTFQGCFENQVRYYIWRHLENCRFLEPVSHNQLMVNKVYFVQQTYICVSTAGLLGSLNTLVYILELLIGNQKWSTSQIWLQNPLHEAFLQLLFQVTHFKICLPQSGNWYVFSQRVPLFSNIQSSSRPSEVSPRFFHLTLRLCSKRLKPAFLYYNYQLYPHNRIWVTRERGSGTPTETWQET